MHKKNSALILGQEKKEVLRLCSKLKDEELACVLGFIKKVTAKKKKT